MAERRQSGDRHEKHRVNVLTARHPVAGIEVPNVSACASCNLHAAAARAAKIPDTAHVPRETLKTQQMNSQVTQRSSHSVGGAWCPGCTK